MEKSFFRNLFKPEVFNLKPEDCENDEEFIDIVSDEVWNLDEWSPEGIMMLKHFVLRLVTKGIPKDHQIDRDYLKKLILQEWEK